MNGEIEQMIATNITSVNYEYRDRSAGRDYNSKVVVLSREISSFATLLHFHITLSVSVQRNGSLG